MNGVVPYLQRRERPGTSDGNLALKVVIGVLGYCAINDGIRKYNAHQRAEARLAPVVEYAEELTRMRMDLNLIRGAIETTGENTEVWAGMLRMSAPHMASGKIDGEVARDRQVIEILKIADREIQNQEISVRLQIAQYRENVIIPLESTIQFDITMGALLAIAAIIRKARENRREQE